MEAVYRYLLPLARIRFVLADDTGAGKTIMTGLLIKELLFRGVLQKVLIITPGGLTKQWKEEDLQEKFGLYARLVNRASFEAEPGQFSRYEEGIFVTSIHFLARNEGCLIVTPLTPRTDEATALKHRHGGDAGKADAHFKSKLASRSWRESLWKRMASPPRRHDGRDVCAPIDKGLGFTCECPI